ncbi:MAG: DNA polymerase I [Bacteroidia bacterium]|nr:DNA polymerase I [Bacteroidia bacterium]
MKTLFLLDAMALIYRAYFVFQNSPAGPRKTSQGQDTSAVFGFMLTLLEVLEKEQPSHLGVAFDPAGPLLRDEEARALAEKYAYKGTRPETPQEIIDAVPIIKELLAAMGIPSLEVPGYEADDVMGTLAQAAEQAGFERVYLFTPDKDMAQLVTERVHLLRPGIQGKPHQRLGPAEVTEKFGVPPHHIADYLGLKGDTSDNIPGVPKIGEKTAVDLITAYGSLEDILARAHELTKKGVRETLLEHAEQGRVSKQLATIRTDVPIAFDAHALERSPADAERLEPLLKQLEFKSLASRLLGKAPTPHPKAAKPATSGQGDLFGSAATDAAPLETTPEAPAEGTYRTLADTPHNYRLLTTREEFEALAAELATAPAFCFDTETTGLDALEADLVGLALSAAPGTGYFVLLPEAFDATQALLEIFRPLLEGPQLKIAQNLKYDLTVLQRYGIHIAPPFADTMLMHYVVRSDGKHGMDTLARSYLGYDPVPIEALIGKKGKQQLSMRGVEPQLVADYAAEDADVTLQLYQKLTPEVDALGVRTVLETIEQPLVPVLAAMEWEGIRVDTDFLREYSKELDLELRQLEESCYRLAGEQFNLNSPKQLGTVLFEKLLLGGEKPRKTATGQYATDEETLMTLALSHDLPAQLLAYRQVAKLKSTYVDALPGLVNPRTGRVHTSYNQAVAVTGRLSSNSPNLQNIPIRTDRGKEVRRAFVPRGPGWVLLSADYSQIELRIMAHLSGDEALKEAFVQGEDIHRATAARIFGVAPEAVDSDMRRKAKTANFGIIYGITAFGLSQRLGIPRGEAKAIIDSYFAQYPGVAEFMTRTVEQARANRYVRTLTGRLHHLPNITSSNPTVRGFTERNAINTPIQGSAADLIKLAMIRLHRAIRAGGYASRMLLQVHDELVFDVPEGEVETLRTLVRHEMEHALELSVPLVADTGVGTNWLDAH